MMQNLVILHDDQQDSATSLDRGKWIASLVNSFKENMNLDRIQDLNNLLDEVQGTMEEPRDFINRINDELVSIFTDCAKETGMLKTISMKANDAKRDHHDRKKWFNKECYNKRKYYHRSKSEIKMQSSCRNLSGKVSPIKSV